LLICWDLAFPEAFRELIAKGAKIMYVLSNVQMHDEFRSHMLTSRDFKSHTNLLDAE
jgi:predicted amidohydrolase